MDARSSSPPKRVRRMRRIRQSGRSPNPSLSHNLVRFAADSSLPSGPSSGRLRRVPLDWEATELGVDRECNEAPHLSPESLIGLALKVSNEETGEGHGLRPGEGFALLGVTRGY